MKHLLGLGLAGLLGITAAGLNWVWISGLALPDEFVATGSDIEYGAEIDEDDLVAVPIPGSRDQLSESFIPWKNRAILFGTLANRDYIAGDVVFHRDIVAPEEDSRWDVIGPFKLISVGERFNERSNDVYDDSRTDGNTVTIAVDANFDARTRKLLDVIRTDNSRDQNKPEIVAVQILAANQRGGQIQVTSTKEFVYQTVSLEGIANVPNVLLAGDMIRFVVPARGQY